MSGGCLGALLIFVFVILVFCVVAIVAMLVFAIMCLWILGIGMGTVSSNLPPIEFESETEIATDVWDVSEGQIGTDEGKDSEDATVTVMIYMNGTDLEQNGAGFASADIEEILNADFSDQVNIIIETIGTTEWEYEGISGETAQRFIVREGELVCVEEELGQLDVTAKEPLTDFITYSADEYPADRYFLILWNHGGGPVYGYGVNAWDEYAYDSLMLDEIEYAILDSGVHFDLIGFDACLMGSMEVAYALRDCGAYLIASEDFEPGSGWEYENWISMLVKEPDISVPELGKIIVDDFVEESEREGEAGILAVVNLSYSEILYQAWTKFAYEAEDTLLQHNFSFEMDSEDRAGIRPLRFDMGSYELEDDYDYEYDVTLDEYCAVDMMAAASCIESDASSELIAALNFAICYAAATEQDQQMTGLSVTLPYGDIYTYIIMEDVFLAAGFDQTYTNWLYAFVLEGSSAEDYDWDDWEWGGWNDNAYDDDTDWEEFDWDSIDWETLEDDYFWEEDSWESWLLELLEEMQ